MAVIAEVTLRGVTREQYDAIRAGTGWLDRTPDGGLAHLAWWEGEDNHNVDAWESEAAFDAFGRDRLGPAMAALGLDTPPEVTFHPAHEVFTPRAGVVAATDVPNVAASSNVDLVAGGYAAFAIRDIDSVMALFADDLVWSTLDSVPFGGVYHGPAGAGEFFANLPQNWAELRVEPERYVDAGDAVVVLGHHRGRSVTGNPMDLAFMHLWTLRDGKATEFTEVLDSAGALQALGTDVEGMLHRMFDEIINAGRLEVVDELFAEDYVDHGPMGDILGREGFKQLVAQWRDAVPDVHCEVDTVVTQGDLSAWLVRTTGTHTGDGLGFPATGRRVETVSANVGRLKDGKAAEHWAEQGIFPMLTQIGVIPAPAASAAVPSPRAAASSESAARPAVP